VEGGGCGDRCIEGIASLRQQPCPGLGRERVGGGYNTVERCDGGSSAVHLSPPLVGSQPRFYPPVARPTRPGDRSRCPARRSPAAPGPPSGRSVPAACRRIRRVLADRVRAARAVGEACEPCVCTMLALTYAGRALCNRPPARPNCTALGR